MRRHFLASPRSDLAILLRLSPERTVYVRSTSVSVEMVELPPCTSEKSGSSSGMGGFRQCDRLYDLRAGRTGGLTTHWCVSCCVWVETSAGLAGRRRGGNRQ